ncbi:Plasmodium variant antigen protein Cir/Yir/Bir, putative [Plasmodium chabaudi chabaudi]|uniref:Plasmodium variant antigen protein Cir/Yir/Bir, putative n=1 Tax=Plasmodium chabaudi chabaudi TaxID=31271 RepID=A0A1D3LA76_PLACU|nr:Plasmodium variant antigen protein Cir/Yir/Bir, putative [Plasmodium chabaudi chabaudi]
MSEEVYKEIKKVDDCLPMGMISKGGSCSIDRVFTDYCPTKTDGGMRQCDTNNEKISAGFIWLLITFEHLCDVNNFVNEMGQYAEYAILWLGYKLNQILDEEITTLKDFYINYIKNNKDEIDYKNHLDNKIDSMDINIKDISNIYEAFGILCEMYTAHNENDKECTNCLENAEEFVQNADEFVQKIEEFNKDPSITVNNSYSKILSTLSNDYNYLKNYYTNNCNKCSNIPKLPEINPQKNSSQNSVQDNVDSSVHGSPQGHADNSLHVSEFASSSSSVASKLIPALLISSIPIFLGIAYKYSLFGFDKRVQRQNLREKPKKIKKKMNLNI